MFNASRMLPHAKTPRGRRWELIRLIFLSIIVVIFAVLTAFGLWIHIFPSSHHCLPFGHPSLYLFFVTMSINVCILSTAVFYWVVCLYIYLQSGKILAQRHITKKRDAYEGRKGLELTRMTESDEKETLLESRGWY